MKLELGQKIGIYEALIDYTAYGATTKCIINNNCYLGINFYDLIKLLDEDKDVNHVFMASTSEVRKVGSLIVKRLK